MHTQFMPLLSQSYQHERAQLLRERRDARVKHSIVLTHASEQAQLDLVRACGHKRTLSNDKHIHVSFTS